MERFEPIIGTLLEFHDGLVAQLDVRQGHRRDSLTKVTWALVTRTNCLLHDSVALLRSRSPEAACIVTRTVVETSVELCFIATRSGRPLQRRFARLYADSVWMHHNDELMTRRRWNLEEPAEPPPGTIEREYRRFVKARRDLWVSISGVTGPNGPYKGSWNGLRVAQTFEQCRLTSVTDLAALYLTYRRLCAFVHTDATSHVLPGGRTRNTLELTRQIVRLLLLTAWLDDYSAGKLVGVHSTAQELDVDGLTAELGAAPG